MRAGEEVVTTATSRGLTLSGTGTLVLMVMSFAALPFLLSPLLPDIARTFDLSPARAGWTYATFGATMALAAPAVGLLGGALPRLPLIRVGLVLFIAGLVLAALSPSFRILLLAMVITGTGGGMYLPAAYALVGDHVPIRTRGHVMGQVMAGWGYAIMLFLPVGGVLADSIGWRAGILLLAVTAGLALAASRLLPGSPATTPTDTRRPTFRTLSSAVFRDPGARRILLVNVCNMVAFYGAYAYLGTWLRTDLGMGSDTAGLLILAYGAGLALITLNSRLLDRLGHRQALYLAYVGLMVGWVALASVTSFWSLAAGLLWIGVFQGIALVGQSTLCSHQSEHGRGAIMAFFTCTTYIGVFAGAALFAPVFAVGGYLPVAALAALLNALAGIYLHLGKRLLREN